MSYPSDKVVEGVKDFLMFELGRPFEDVAYKSGGKIVVRSDGAIPDTVAEELRKILPPEYTLVIEE